MNINVSQFSCRLCIWACWYHVTSASWVIFHDFFFVVCWLFSTLTFSKKSFSSTIGVSNSWDQDQVWHSVGPDLGPNWLQQTAKYAAVRQMVETREPQYDQTAHNLCKQFVTRSGLTYPQSWWVFKLPKLILKNSNRRGKSMQNYRIGKKLIVSNTSCLLNGIDKQGIPRSDCFWRSSLIRIFPVCYSDRHFFKAA